MGLLYFTYGLASNRTDKLPVFYTYQVRTFCVYECVSNKSALTIVEKNIHLDPFTIHNYWHFFPIAAGVVWLLHTLKYHQV